MTAPKTTDVTITEDVADFLRMLLSQAQFGAGTPDFDDLTAAATKARKQLGMT